MKKTIALHALVGAMSLAAFASAQAQTRLTIPAGSITASASDGNVPANTNDGSLTTRWSADASSGAQWVQYNLGGCYNVTGLNLAWYNGNARHYNFSIQTSVDGINWTSELDGVSAANSSGLLPYSVAEVAAKYVRVASTGSDVNKLVGLSEAQIFSSGAANCPAPESSQAGAQGMQALVAAPAATAAAAAAAAAAFPGQNFNLGGYTLQLPTGAQGNVDTKSGSDLEGGYTNSHYFYSDSDGAMVMMDPRQGYTTSGSQHPRTEMRENATWTTGGTNLLDASVKVTKVPGNTTIAQIFQGTGPSKPLCELQYNSSGTVKLFLEKTNQGGSSTSTPITTVPLGTKFTYQLKLSGKTITVKINGTSQSFTMDDSFVGERFYFKAGNYDQTATQGTPQTADGTVVKFYTLKITH